MMKTLKLLLRASCLIFLSWCLAIARANATPEILGQYPVCEPSAVVKVTCPESGGDCLLVGDNEQKTSLFLYPVNSERLESTTQNQLELGERISDIEAIAKLDDDKVLIFGSHSRNSNCETKKKRRQFLQARVLSNSLKPIDKIIKSPKIESKVLFDGTDIDKNEKLQAVSRVIDEAEVAANKAEEDKTACQKANAFNAEGAVTVLDSSVWIGLRSPLVSLEQKNYATLLRMASPLDKYRFDEVAFLDLEGRGIRELTLDENWIWGIAGGPEDGLDNFVLWKLPTQSLNPNAILEPEIVRELPASSEGLVIVEGTAYVLIDGDSGNSDDRCEIPGQFIQFAIQ
ncbi:MAG: DUF3616 domain-containing protein [Xenococcaceae cyanobacterium]